MAKLGPYCRAFLVSDFQRFPGWKPDLDPLRPKGADESGATAPRTELRSDDVLFLHEDLAVTDGHRREEGVVFESTDPSWRRFCTEELDFEVPAEMVAVEA